MNSFRIGIIGLLVEYYGIAMAEGFLHWFEGWVIFLACVAILLLEIKLLLLLSRSPVASGRRVFDALDLSWPGMRSLKQVLLPAVASRHALKHLLICLVLLVAFVPVSFAIKGRQEVVLPRSEFVAFPMFYKDWVGRQGFIQADVLTSLRLSDHIVADYRVSGNGLPVNLYVAYYDSQRKGASVHSPRSCIPGGGWEIQSLARKNILFPAGSAPLAVNRVLIQKGNARRLVYYWFQQRGRVITDEYAAKWYIFWDGLTRNRTDGALVRVTVPVSKTQGESDADEQLVRFIRDFKPLISQFIPD
ncbi:MAG TPA: EpsI family protein [Porticoccaceae bacterium]|nr:EpsI family protein [Porticoccaceae bacterium]